MQTAAVEKSSDEDGSTERWTERRDGGGGSDTINLTVTAEPLTDSTGAATLGTCECVRGRDNDI